MITDLKSYPAMKDSGVEWLGDVPAHWDIERGKWLFRKVERPVRDVDKVVTCFRDGVVTLRKNRRAEGFTESLKEIGYQGIRVGDLVIHAMDVSAGAVGVSDSDGKGTPVYAVCQRRQNVDSYYYAFVVREMARSRWILALATGIRERSTDFRFRDFANQRLPLPPFSEQTAIVRYLDYVGRRVQQFVKAKQKLIKLLEEQKQAIIHRAVTRGLDPDVPLKDSGVEWLGKVPAHWKVRRLRNIVDMRVSSVDKFTKEGEIPIRLCNYVDVYKNDWIDAQMDFMRATATDEEIERFRLAKGDVLITKDSEAWDDIGVPALVTNPAPDLVSGYHLALLRPSVGKIAGGYLFYALQSKGLACQFHTEAKGVTRYGLAHFAIKSVWLPLPSLSEQTAIAEYLDKVAANIDAIIARTRREISLLQEYHTRLTADVVTGKVDVRDAAANFPDVPKTKADITVEESQT